MSSHAEIMCKYYLKNYPNPLHTILFALLGNDKSKDEEIRQWTKEHNLQILKSEN
mgnify:CR=1 FL=1